MLGGAGGAMVGGLLVRSGVTPTTAAVGVTVAGSVGAAMAKKGTPMRLASGGAAAAGAGQLALAWLASQGTKKTTTVSVRPTHPKPKNAADPGDVEAAFERAREELAMQDEADAFADDYDQEVAA